MTVNVNITELINEFVYQRYVMNNSHIRQYFKELNIPEYIALNNIAETASHESIYSGKTYLKDLSDKMQIPIRRISKIIGALRDRGLVNWSYDGDGDDGTYVVITEEGLALINNQEKTLNDYYGRVIEKYGIDNMIQLLQMMKRLETVMSRELEDTEAVADVNEANE